MAESTITENAKAENDSKSAKPEAAPNTPQNDKTKTAPAALAPNTSLIYSRGKWQGAPNAPTDDMLKANPGEITFQFHKEVLRANIDTRSIQQQLHKDLLDWTAAEGVMYATTIETLVDAPHFIIPIEGAGRAQLQHLVDLHQGHSKRATQTLIKV